MHFDGSKAFLISAIVVTAASILSFSCIFAIPKGFKLAPDNSSVTSFVPSGVLSVALLFMAFYMMSKMQGDPVSSSTLIGSIIYYLPSVLALLAILSAVYFLLSIMNSKRISNSKAILGMTTVIFLVLYGVYLYFNKSVHPTNSPNKIVDQMAYFFAAVFFLFETRNFLGRDAWRAYIPLGLITSLLCGYSGLPSLILYFANGTLVSDSINETVLTLALFIYVTWKVILTLRLPADDLCKTASAIERLAGEREEEIARRRSSRAHDYNIMEENSTEEVEESTAEEHSPILTEGQISFELDGSEG